MKTNVLSLIVIVGAVAVPLAATAPRWNGVLAQTPLPRNQAEFDRFAAQLEVPDRAAQLNRAGNAFDNGESRLFWFTDLDAARAQAKIESKPILSLRLLGNLSDELSCANSRLFRVMLYPNAAINRQLRENFVLHWSSERPVPVATIDMGDGRVMKRTLTGNSAHYLLSADGQPLDVLPGLYAPAEFAAWLQRGAEFARDWQAADAGSRAKKLSDWHRARLIAITGEPGAAQIVAANALQSDASPVASANARDASLLTAPKRAMELPVLNAASGAPSGAPSGAIAPNAFSITGLQRAPRFVAALDQATRARIAAMQPEHEASELIQTLERNVARDTQNNRRNFEPAIHAYFVNEAKPDFAQLNGAIYSKLFRTPASDPWLGLAPADAFVALRNGGVQSASPTPQRVAQTP